MCFSLCRRVSLIANDKTMALPNASAAAFAVVPVSTTLSIRQGIRPKGSSLICWNPISRPESKNHSTRHSGKDICYQAEIWDSIR